tara:strand:+ start:167 stop:343 length:177 start_codon:yes stop_codon:yes gene_type:complete
MDIATQKNDTDDILSIRNNTVTPNSIKIKQNNNINLNFFIGLLEFVLFLFFQEFIEHK